MAIVQNSFPIGCRGRGSEIGRRIRSSVPRYRLPQEMQVSQLVGACRGVVCKQTELQYRYRPGAGSS